MNENVENKGKIDKPTMGVTSTVSQMVLDINNMINTNSLQFDKIYQLVFITALCKKYEINLNCQYDSYSTYIEYIRQSLMNKIISSYEEELYFYSLKDLATMKVNEYRKIIKFMNDYSVEDTIDFVKESFTKTFRNNINYPISDEIIELILKIFNIKNNSSVLDVFSGEGDFLVKVGINNPSVRLFGNEINFNNSLISKIRLYLINLNYNIDNTNILFRNDNTNKYNYIFACLPFEEENVMYESINYNFKHINSTEWKYIYKLLDILDNKGKIIVLMPLLPLYKIPDIEIRKDLVKRGFIETLIELPCNTIYNNSKKIVMMILSKNNSTVRFVNVNSMILGNEDNNKIDIANIEHAYNDEKLIDSKIVSNNEIENNNFNLLPKKYLNNINKELKKPKLLRDYVTITRGYQGVINNKNINYNCKLVNLSNIVDGIIDKENLVDIEYNEKMNKYVLKDKDVLITARGSRFESAVIEIENNEILIVSGNLFIIRVVNNKLNPYYLKLFLDSELGQKILFSNQVKTNVMSINNKNFKDLYFEYRPVEEQNKIAKIYLEKQKKILINKQQIQKLKKEISNILLKY